MASGGETPTFDRTTSTNQSTKKLPNPKHTRSAQLGWLTQCYGKVLAAVGEPDNQHVVAELCDRLKELWEKYENAHSEYLAATDLSPSKLSKLDNQHEEHRGDYYRAIDTMRRYLNTGLTPRGSLRRTHGGSSEQQQSIIMEELENARRDSTEAKRRLEYYDMERKFLQQNAELAEMRLSLYEARTEKSERRRVADYPREPTGSPRRMSSLIDSTPPVQRSLATEMQAAATSSNENHVSTTPTEGHSALRDVRRHIARSGNVATQVLQQEILQEWRQSMSDNAASRPVMGRENRSSRCRLQLHRQIA